LIASRGCQWCCIPAYRTVQARNSLRTLAAINLPLDGTVGTSTFTLASR
jgi:hypothetical protein